MQAPNSQPMQAEEIKHLENVFRSLMEDTGVVKEGAFITAMQKLAKEAADAAMHGEDEDSDLEEHGMTMHEMKSVAHSSSLAEGGGGGSGRRAAL